MGKTSKQQEHEKLQEHLAALATRQTQLAAEKKDIEKELKKIEKTSKTTLKAALKERLKQLPLDAFIQFPLLDIIVQRIATDNYRVYKDKIHELSTDLLTADRLIGLFSITSLWVHKPLDKMPLVEDVYKRISRVMDNTDALLVKIDEEAMRLSPGCQRLGIKPYALVMLCPFDRYPVFMFVCPETKLFSGSWYALTDGALRAEWVVDVNNIGRISTCNNIKLPYFKYLCAAVCHRDFEDEPREYGEDEDKEQDT